MHAIIFSSIIIRTFNFSSNVKYSISMTATFNSYFRLNNVGAHFYRIVNLHEC